ncbi:MAG: hypothetical protein AAB432_02265 [Patescibacteria group bacterium]
MVKRYVFRIRKAEKAIFDAIESGRKKVETRAASVRYRDIKAGDEITFVCGSSKLKKKVTRARRFDSVDAMLRIYKARNINPESSSKEDLQKMYDHFPAYGDKIRKRGLIVLELK